MMLHIRVPVYLSGLIATLALYMAMLGGYSAPFGGALAFLSLAMLFGCGVAIGVRRSAARVSGSGSIRKWHLLEFGLAVAVAAVAAAWASWAVILSDFC
jgi:hypothetical protein